jgi:hepatocyte growth factor-regulated tyrosine kinase substrate
MLEERLSKAYSQHTLGGYSLPPPRQQITGPYPTLQSNVAAAATPAESFYTGDQQDFGRTQPQQYQRQPQAAPQPHYPPYDKRASVAVPAPGGQYASEPQRTNSWQGGAPRQPSNPAQPPPQQVPVATPSTDPHASFYFNQPQQPSQTLPASIPSAPLGPDTSQSPYPNLQQAMQFQQPSVAQTPTAQPAQINQPQTQPIPPQQSQHSGPHQMVPPQQNPYWQPSVPAPQHQAAPSQRPPAWQAQTSSYNGYTPDAFPSAPQNAPKQPVVEESLIEL